MARRYRTAYIEVARKNAKSTLCSGISLYTLFADKEGGAEVYSAATKEDQAMIVFGDAEKMVKRSPLKKHIDILHKRLLHAKSQSVFAACAGCQYTRWTQCALCHC